MKCKKAKILLAPYILGDLADDLELSTQLETHLKNCNNCTEEYQEIRQTLQFVEEYKEFFAEAFAKIDQKRAREEHTQKRVWKKVFPKNSKSLQFSIRIGAVAACLVIGFGLFFAMNQFNKPQNNSSPIVSNQQQGPVKIELVSDNNTEVIPAGRLITTANELKTLRINGNRQMVLNVGTELTIEPCNLGCVVKLDQGEIYTEVEHDGKPFIIETSHGRAVITGTTFNIKADDNKMDLAVVEGSVRFESGKGSVDVKGGYQSSIAASIRPTKPIACNVIQIAKWAKKQDTNPTLMDMPSSNTDISDLSELSLVHMPYCDLEDIDFEIWIDQRREWFEREFPWTKRLQKLLAQNDIEVDTIDLLVESGDLWRFAWPEYSQQRILADDREAVQAIATRYDIEIDQLMSAGVPYSYRNSNVEPFERWLNEFDNEKSNLTINSIHAAIFLINTRTLIYYTVGSGKVHVENKRQSLGLLKEQLKTASNSLKILNQMLLADKSQTVCSVAQYDEYIKKIKDDILAMMENDKKQNSDGIQRQEGTYVK